MVLVTALVAIVISWLFITQLLTFSVIIMSLSLQAKVKILVGAFLKDYFVKIIMQPWHLVSHVKTRCSKILL